MLFMRKNLFFASGVELGECSNEGCERRGYHATVCPSQWMHHVPHSQTLRLPHRKLDRQRRNQSQLNMY